MAQNVSNFKVVEPHPNGITASDAARKYGETMLPLRTVYPMIAAHKLGGQRLSDDQERALRDVRQILTGTYVGFSRLPLSDTIQSDGNTKFLVATYTAGYPEVITWRLQIPEKFMRAKLLKKPGFFVIETGMFTRPDGSREYTTIVGQANDMRIGVIPEAGNARMSDYPLLFGPSAHWSQRKKGFPDAHLLDAFGDFAVKFSISPLDVQVGLVSVRAGFLGGDAMEGETEWIPAEVQIGGPFAMQVRHSVLVEGPADAKP